jgi:histidyl-tRNA synthetase
VELYPEPKKLGQQLKYAHRRGFPIALIAGQRELDAGVCQIKHLASGKSEEVSIADGASAVIDAIRATTHHSPLTTNH